MHLGRTRSLIVALALALLLAACGGSASSSDTAVAETAVEDTAVLVGDFPTVSGEGIELNSLEGQDVVLWFWAPW